MTDLSLPGLPRALRSETGLLRYFTSAGRGVLLLGAVALVVGLLAGYGELLLLGALCLVLLAIGLLLMQAPARVRAQLRLDQTRTVAGESIGGRIDVTSLNALPLSTPVVEVPVLPRFTTGGEGPSAVLTRLPTLAHNQSGTAAYRLPELARGVHLVGPARVRRTDPLRLVVRRIDCTTTAEVYARPETVPLEALGQGFVSDLEGKPSDEISMSDLAFHALREYVRGDDLRHVHWRSSARVGQLHVRQYHDTRRSHSTVLVDDAADAYLTAGEFELALSIAGSVAMRLTSDDNDVTLVCGPLQVSGPPSQILDGLCRAHRATDGSLLASAERAARVAPMTSQLFVVTGQVADPKEVSHTKRPFGVDIQHVGVRAAVARPEPEDDEERDGEREAWKRDRAAAARGLLSVPELTALPQVLAVHTRRSV